MRCASAWTSTTCCSATSAHRISRASPAARRGSTSCGSTSVSRPTARGGSRCAAVLGAFGQALDLDVAFKDHADREAARNLTCSPRPTTNSRYLAGRGMRLPSSGWSGGCASSGRSGRPRARAPPARAVGQRLPPRSGRRLCASRRSAGCARSTRRARRPCAASSTRLSPARGRGRASFPRAAVCRPRACGLPASRCVARGGRLGRALDRHVAAVLGLAARTAPRRTCRAIARGTWKWLSARADADRPDLVAVVMCPRRHSSGRIQRGSAFCRRPTSMRNQITPSNPRGGATAGRPVASSWVFSIRSSAGSSAARCARTSAAAMSSALRSASSRCGDLAILVLELGRLEQRGEVAAGYASRTAPARGGSIHAASIRAPRSTDSTRLRLADRAPPAPRCSFPRTPGAARAVRCKGNT